ncbi:MAG: LTA synthase family protein, partial [Muribaculaceae bacterium]|nr:LTA synthase family protein [Muribaculaceae bacterium]
MTRWTNPYRSRVVAGVLNLLLALLVLMLARVVFYCENWSTFAPWQSWSLLWSELRGALTFDLSAALYVNALYLVLLLLPWHGKERPAFHRGLRWLFVVTNALALASNLCDAVYFQYTGRRTTITVLSEFAHEGNLGGIVGTELLRHWYLVVAFVLLTWLLWRGFVVASHNVPAPRWRYYLTQTLALAIAAPLAIVGIRGSATAGTRPITVSNATQWVNRPIEAALVLNTPFSIIRSIGKKVFITPNYMTLTDMEATYSPEHRHPMVDSLSRPGRNVVVLIVESLGKEYIGSMNRDLDSGNYRGYTPFIDSLAARSMTFRYSFANGRKSMDAMPSILAGLPMMVETFFLTPASLNDMQGLPALLQPMGYSSAFFHGGHNISMGFSAFAHTIGFQRYYGLDEYCQSPNHHGMDDFDGKWAIWDEPFLQYMLDVLATQPQPFVVGAFTASSHHPYHVPPQYADSLRDEGGRAIHKCVRYTDLALRRFFERAATQPWYRNTVFVLVADHTNQT